MRQTAKSLVMFFFWLVSKITFRSGPVVLVLMYHSVNNDKTWRYSVSPGEFALQLDYLKKWGDIVPLSKIVEYVTGEREVKRNTAAITFDDGYLDTYETVFPLVQKHNIPITIFLTTDLERSEILGNFPRPTWEQLQIMHRSGLVSVQVHGHKHLNLKKISHNLSLLNEEIILCRDSINRNLGFLANYVAYAGGYRNGQVVDYLKGKGFLSAFGITEGTLNVGDDLFRLRRIQIDKTTTLWQFRMRLSKAVDYHRRFVDFVRTYVYKQR